MKSIPITQARQDLYNIVAKTIDENIPVQILGKRSNAMLVSDEDWDAIQETLHLLSVKGFRESLTEAENDEWLSEDEVDF